jgi:hypothetical protein
MQTVTVFDNKKSAPRPIGILYDTILDRTMIKSSRLALAIDDWRAGTQVQRWAVRSERVIENNDEATIRSNLLGEDR